MKKTLSELFGKNMYEASALANEMRSLKNEYRSQVQALDRDLDAEFKNKPTLERGQARAAAIASLDENFSINAAATLMADHGVTELIDDMAKDKPRAFPIAANKLEN